MDLHLLGRHQEVGHRPVLQDELDVDAAEPARLADLALQLAMVLALAPQPQLGLAAAPSPPPSAIRWRR